MLRSDRNWPQLGCAALLTAAVAFPAGLWVAGSSDPAPSPPARASANSEQAVRNPYSATVRSDPFVLQRQRTLVEAMENACRREGSLCPEARAARRYLDARMTPD